MPYIPALKEAFALAPLPDREKVVDKLASTNTEDWFYYRGLILLQKLHDLIIESDAPEKIRNPTAAEAALMEEFTGLLENFQRKFNEYNEKYTLLRSRYHVLIFTLDPSKSTEFIKKDLYLDLDLTTKNTDSSDANNTSSNQGETSGPTKKSYPTALNPELIDTKKLIQDIFKKIDSSNSYLGLEPMANSVVGSMVAENSLALTKTQELVYLNSIMDSPSEALTEINVVQRITEIVKSQSASKDSDFQLNNVRFDNFTLDQMNNLMEAIPEGVFDCQNFINAYLKKLVPAEYSQYVYGKITFWEDSNDILGNYLDQLELFVTKLPDMYQSLKAAVQFHKLRRDIARQEIDEARFVSYLNKASKTLYEFSPKPARTSIFGAIAEDTKKFTITLPLLGSSTISRDDEWNLIKEYLTGLVVQGKLTLSLESLGKFIDYHNTLKPLYAEIMLTHSQNQEAIDKAIEIVGVRKYEEIVKKTSLTFPPSTLYKASKRKPEDTIDIILRSKNIPRVSVRVYQIDTLNYWRLQLKTHGRIPSQPFQSKDMNLDGLCPTWENEIDIKLDSALLETDTKLSFGQDNIAPEIFRGRGLWVLEFIGGSEQCRVVVQKGYLRHIMQNTTGGHIIQVIDEVGQPFCSQDVKVWHANQFYKADKNGNILVSYLPSNESNSNCDMLLVSEKDGFSEPFNFQRLSENYQFNADFYVNPEMVSYNKTSKVVINPRLELCGLPISLSLLENVKLNVNCANVRDVKSGTTFTNMAINKNSLLTAEFVVPEQLTYLEFELEATVKNLSGAEEKLHASFLIDYSFDSEQTAETASIQLKVTPDMKYLVYALGKNGEPKSGYEVEFQFKNVYLPNAITQILQTNDEGVIELGELSDIQYLTAIASGNYAKWDVLKSLDETKVLLPPSFCVQANKEFKITCPTQLSESNYSIYSIGAGQSVLKKLDGKMKKQNGYVVISGLPEGAYQINVPSTKEGLSSYKCTVIEKENNIDNSEETKNLWSNWIIGKDQYSKESGNVLYRPLGIKEIQMTENNITFSLKNWSSKTVAIITTSTFVPSNNDSLSARLQNPRSLPNPFVYNHLVNQTRTVFLDGCRLGEEYQYILNRGKAEKWIGSTLTKPSLLMYPKKIAETKSIQRDLKKAKATGGAFGQAYGGAAPAASLYRSAFCKSKMSHHGPYRSTLAFLKHASPLSYFYPDQESGTISIDRSSLGEGNLLEMVIVSGEQVIAKEFVFPDQASLDFKHNDIRQSVASENKDTVLIRSKAVSCLQPSDTMELKNTNGEWKAIDSFEKLYEYSQRISSSFSSDFNFLSRWSTFSTSEKLKLHEEHVCHEFNFWLKKKDAEFFNTFVAPAIQSKIQKSFMDLYLVEADLSKFENNIYLFNKLSTPEKALLAIRQGGDTLTKVLRLFDDSFEKKLDSRSEIYFDSILTSCDVQESESDLEGMCLDIDTVIQRGERLDGLVAETAAISGRSLAFGQPPPPPPPGAPGALFAAQQVQSMAQNSAYYSPSSPQYSPSSPMNDVVVERAISYDEDDEDEVDDDDDFEVQEELREQSMRRRKKVKYTFTGPTTEWAEVSYYNGTSPTFISPSQFWVDLLQHYQSKPDKHFLSENFIYALSSMSEVLFVLSLIDLPFSSKADWRKEVTESGLKISAETPLMVFYRSLQEPSDTSLTSSGVILSQELFVYDPSIDVASEDCVKVNSNLLETDVEYGRQLIISNITSKELVCQITIQIPSGSVPTREAPYFQSKSISISPYSTWNDISGTFYFPSSGDFILPSVSVATSTGSLIAKSDVREFTVSSDKNQMTDLSEATDGSDTIAKISNWPSIASKGSTASVVSFLESYKKLDRVDFNLICWRMTDPSFARDIFTVLGKSRSYYTQALWQYGVYHRFADIVRELLLFNKLNYNSSNFLGHTFDSVLISVEPSPFDSEQHVLDYYPLMNARSHPLNSEKHEILNTQFHKKYDVFLSYLEQKTTPFSIPDLVMLTLYLIIQERIGEAHDMFARIPKDQNECTVQVDYLGAYLSTRIRADQCTLDAQLDLQKTKDKILTYKQFGVLKWRKLFASLLDYINEVEQGRGISCDNETFTSDRLQTRAIHTEPTLDFEIDSNNAKLVVHYSNLESIDIRCYEMNVEVMFSENPFLHNSRIASSKQENYSWIKPSYSQHVELSKEESHKAMDTEDEYDIIGAGAVNSIRTITIDLPKKLISSDGKNVFVELTSPDSPALKRRQAYFANRLAVHTVESFGIVRVLNEASKHPVPGVYVKVYARKKDSKEVQFWKDGYTGLNGVFDYISVTEGNALMGGSNVDLKTMMENTIDKLSLLILSSQDGAVVKEVYPPIV